MFSSLYNTFENVEQFEEILNSPTFVVFDFVVDVVIWLVGHLLMAFALVTLAKKQNIKNKWLAFIPFFNFIILGKIVGQATIWGKRIKNAGLFAAIFGLASTLVSWLLYFGNTIVLIESIFNVTISINNETLYAWLIGESLAWEIVSFIGLALDIGYIFFEVSLIILIFRLYCPQRTFIYSLLSIFLNPPLFGILLFVIRNNPRHVQVVRPLRGYYENFENYNNYSQTANQNKKAENPFPEFGGEENSSNDKGDGFFD